MTVIIGIITLAFLSCTWPYVVLFMMKVNNKVILQRIVTLMYLNSLINPVLYILINKQVSKAIFRMFTCQKQEEGYELYNSFVYLLLVLVLDQWKYEE